MNFAAARVVGAVQDLPYLLGRDPLANVLRAKSVSSAPGRLFVLSDESPHSFIWFDRMNSEVLHALDEGGKPR